MISGLGVVIDVIKEFSRVFLKNFQLRYGANLATNFVFSAIGLHTYIHQVDVYTADFRCHLLFFHLIPVSAPTIFRTSIVSLILLSVNNP